MSRVPLALAAVLVALPAASRADDWADDRAEVRPAGGYDVSVDLNVQGGVGFETFHAPLQAYGDWVVVGSYGTVWRPRVAAGWRPYYYGRWEWTNEGWFWVSDEPWGWAAYHYGRWAYDPYYSWVWVPGYEWAPAWVSWRSSGDVVGWAPLAPGYSVFVTTYPYVDAWWTFVPCNRFVSVPVYSVAYAPGYARRWYDSSAPAPAFAPRGGAVARGSFNAPAWGGPAPRSIEQRMGRPLAPARIVRTPTPGERGRPGEIAVYRPERGPVSHGPPAHVDRGGPAWGAQGGERRGGFGEHGSAGGRGPPDRSGGWAPPGGDRSGPPGGGRGGGDRGRPANPGNPGNASNAGGGDRGGPQGNPGNRGGGDRGGGWSPGGDRGSHGNPGNAGNPGGGGRGRSERSFR